MRLAEAVRFELTDGCPSLVFKTSALNHSATLPGTQYCSRFAGRMPFHVAKIGDARRFTHPPSESHVIL